MDGYRVSAGEPVVVGGSKGVGLAVSVLLAGRGRRVHVLSRTEPDCAALSDAGVSPDVWSRLSWHRFDASEPDLSLLNSLCERAGGLFVTAGIGRVAPFGSLSDGELRSIIGTNLLGPMRTLGAFWCRLRSADHFPCAVMTSIAGRVASPLFSAYSASKFGLRGFVEALNGELAAEGCPNRILDVAPGHLSGTTFDGGNTHLPSLLDFAREIVVRAERGETLWIPDFDEVYGEVIERYREDPEGFAVSSYRYKIAAGRCS